MFWKALQDLAAAGHPQAALHTYNGTGPLLSPSRGDGTDAGRRPALRTDCPDVGSGRLPDARAMRLFPAKPPFRELQSVLYPGTAAGTSPKTPEAESLTS